jgi:hypothetical protein
LYYYASEFSPFARISGAPIKKVSDIHRGGADDAEGEFEKKSLRTLCLSLMKIRSRSHLEFLQSDFVTESLQPVEAAFCYSLTVAFVKVVSSKIGISLFAS